jgi:hypothetical protein
VTVTTIKAIVRNGRIEVDEPIDLPDGTQLTIPIPESPGLGVSDKDWSDSPEAIEAWIRWYDALEPVEFTPSERAARETARREQKEFELAQWERRSKQIEERFP